MLILLRVVFFLRKNLDEALSTDLFAKASSSFQDQKNLHRFLGQSDITVVLNFASLEFQVVVAVNPELKVMPGN